MFSPDNFFQVAANLICQSRGGQVEAAHFLSDTVSINVSLFHLLLLMLTTTAINKAIFSDHYHPGAL